MSQAEEKVLSGSYFDESYYRTDTIDSKTLSVMFYFELWNFARFLSFPLADTKVWIKKVALRTNPVRIKRVRPVFGEKK